MERTPQYRRLKRLLPKGKPRRICGNRRRARRWSAAGALLTDLAPVLSSDALDPKLMRIAILTDATPRGLAEFAQQGADKEKLLETLFADEPLMRQILEAGGANGAEYGETMEVYTAILAKSEKAREPGSIFQRLALGTAIQMPWTNGKPESGVHGIVQRTQYDVDQVAALPALRKGLSRRRTRPRVSRT